MPLVHRRVLASQADDLAHPLWFAGDIDAVDQHFAGKVLQQCRDDFDDRGFAGAIGPQQPQHAALLDRQVQAIQGLHGAE